MMTYSKSNKSSAEKTVRDIRRADPPPLNWSTLIVRKRRIRYGNQETQTRRDCHQVRQVELLVGQGMVRIDAISQISIAELLPLFNFDFTRGSPFDIRSTPSQMGALTERGRFHFGAARTGHAMYSFAAISALASRFDGLVNHFSYGPDSPFQMLRDLGGKIAVLDLPD